MRVESPTPRYFYGNLMGTGPAAGESRETRSDESVGLPYDLLNVEELVRVSSPVTGEWVATVTMFAAPRSGVEFSLVVTGAVANV